MDDELPDRIQAVTQIWKLCAVSERWKQAG